MQLKSLAKTTEALNSITTVLNTTYGTRQKKEEALALIGKSYTTETLKSALAQSTLNKEQIKVILSANGLQGELLETTADELANAASTNMVAKAQAGTTGTTLGLGLAFKGLGITIRNTTKAIWAFLTTSPVGWLTLAVGAIAAVTSALIWNSKSAERAKEKISDLQDEYSNAVSELESVKKEFESINERIDELQALYYSIGREVIKRNKYKTNQHISSLNPSVYGDIFSFDSSKTIYSSVDIEKGAVEIFNHRGKHQDEYTYTGTPRDKQDNEKHHDINHDHPSNGWFARPYKGLLPASA